ncbi:MAG: cation diffusion facilitator family transporter [Actinomycetota bacterium]
MNPLGRTERVALIALLVTVALATAKVAVWAATGSLAVLSQALDSVLDVVALGLVFVGVRVATKPADESHHYGHAKAENLVAFTQTLILGAIVLGVVIEATTRLADPEAPPESPWYAFALLAISAAVDGVRYWWMSITARREGSEALRAGALNLATDIGTSVVALGSLALVRAGADGADAIGALIVAAAVVLAGSRLGKRSVDVLMDRAPGGPVQAIAAAAASAPGVAEARRVRVRSSGKQLFADVTVGAGRTTSLERAHDIAEAVEREIARVVPGTDVVVHVEPVSETSGLVERVSAAASRIEGIHEVHNVLVHAFSEGGREKLHVTLHAKVEPGTPLGHAHDLSDRLETAVRADLGYDVRVDSHIEPLEPTSFGHDVTVSRRDIVASVREAALEESDVMDCHEVLVTSAGDELSVVAHVRGRKDLPLDRIHGASQRIEKGVHASHPEVGSVVIHFEPA